MAPPQTEGRRLSLTSSSFFARRSGVGPARPWGNRPMCDPVAPPALPRLLACCWTIPRQALVAQGRSSARGPVPAAPARGPRGNNEAAREMRDGRWGGGFVDASASGTSATRRHQQTRGWAWVIVGSGACLSLVLVVLLLTGTFSFLLAWSVCVLLCEWWGAGWQKRY